MKLGTVVATLHKWIALIIAGQLLFWFASGLFFVSFPIKRVRSEHTIAKAAAAPIPLTQVAGLARIGGDADRIELRRIEGRAVALLFRGDDRPRVHDLATGVRLPPISASQAARIAAAGYSGPGRPARVSAVVSGSPEYRGALPAWRVDMADADGLALYVSADLGTVTARRSTLWRVYDFLWGLHIMDWRDHEDFNHPVLIAVTALGLLVVLTGFVLFPYRMFRPKRRPAEDA